MWSPCGPQPSLDALDSDLVEPGCGAAAKAREGLVSVPASFLTNGKGPPSTARLTRGQLRAIARNLTNQQSESRQATYDAGQAVAAQRASAVKTRSLIASRRACPEARSCVQDSLIIPSAVDPPVRGAGQAPMVKVERPTGRMTLTIGAWSARLARVDGRRDDQAGPQPLTDAPARVALLIIPEPERPRRRPDRLHAHVVAAGR